ncbi:MAG: alpha-amylase family glycosyl hydrolase [Phycisphaerae bacterium]
MAHTTPDSLRHAVVYQVFPRLHSESGDFAGVRRDLPRIRSLGTDVLYLMPVHPMGDGRDNRLGSPYGIHDHRAINPEYGTPDDLRRLVDEAHELGMRVILDVVLHHLSARSALAASKPEWFLKDATGKLTTKVPAWAGVADLDYRHPDVWDYQIQTLRGLLELGIDGFRFDVVPLVPMDFWRRARAELDPAGEQLWLAESGFMRFVKKDKDLGILHHSDPELHDVFDLTYDADGQEYLHAYFAGQAPLAEYLKQVYLQEVLYPAHAIKLRLLESHDDPRFAMKVREPHALQCWTAFMTLLPGAMLLYAGQEYALGRDREVGSRGQEHYHRERHNVPWDGGDEAFFAFTRRLLACTREVKRACRVCHVSQVTAGVVRIDWRGPDKAFAGIFNLENRFGEVPVPWKLAGRDALGGKDVKIAGTYTIASQPVLLELDPATAPAAVDAGETFALHGGANWASSDG